MTAKNEITLRIENLRKVMKEHKIDAYILPNSDGHLSEYTPEYWKGRTWISGFNGSAGSILITLNKAGLWTDSRYFLQGAAQLEGTPIELFKEGVSGVPSMEEFLAKELPQGAVVGCDGNCFSRASIEALSSALKPFDISVNSDYDLLIDIWKDRPEIPKTPFFEHPLKYSGENTSERIPRVISELKKKGANTTIITTLDELAWIFNIRGCDVECNPVGVGYGFISENEAILFTFEEKIDENLSNNLLKQGVKILPYHNIFEYIASLDKKSKIFIDKNRMTQRIFENIPSHCTLIEGLSIVTLLKSYKNQTEIKGERASMIRDGVALTRLFKWLEETLAKGETPDEVEVAEKLTGFAALDKMYVGASFDTICGYNDHGAIVHYKAEKSTAHKLQNKGVLLLDSGRQYFDGTTDITRTIALGPDTPEPQLIKDYTLVLKGHIAIATATFPEGTRGNQLDILARKALWDEGLSFGHGTGHGVGIFLNVHEGPQNIRTDNNPTPMAIGTFSSNEPGMYRSGKYGIRIENLIITKEKMQTEFGKFLGFETLTLCYMDNRLVDKTLLTEKEINWYNAYQKEVFDKLSPYLSSEEKDWLQEKTRTI